MPKSRKKPAYLLHKPTGQARCRIDGKDIYFGQFGTPVSRERYEDLIRDWALRTGDVNVYSLTIDDLAIRYLDHARSYYRRKDGSRTAEVTSLRYAIRPVVRVFGRVRARDFGPLKLKEARQSMIDAGYCRTNINRMVDRIRRMFAWGVENELIPAERLQALRAVPGLRAGRTRARESAPVVSVPDDVIEKTLSHLSDVVADMVRLQLLTGRDLQHAAL